MTPLRPPGFGGHTPQAHDNTVAEMAACLRRNGATQGEREAIRCLMAHGFAHGEIAVLSDRALVEAQRAIVTDAMREG